MSIRTSRWPAGVPCWADLTVPDPALVRPFYEAVLGWTLEEAAPEFGGYSIATIKGAAAAGIGPQQFPGLPTWTLYFATDDVEATAEQIRHQGGLVVVPPDDVGDLGRLLIATDPTGAMFGVWQAGSHIGAGLVNEPGGLTWEDLRSPDPATAQGFYAAVFGHRMQPLEMAGPDYATFHLGEEEAPLGGIGGLNGVRRIRSGSSTSRWPTPMPRWQPPRPTAGGCRRLRSTRRSGGWRL
jgi:uncharacterized protein